MDTQSAALQGHTPGPWRSVLFLWGDETGIPPTEVFGVHDNNGLIADTVASGRTMAENEANARLIAAAPEMLAELEHTLAVIEELLDYGYLPAETGAALRHRAQRIRLTIAKTEASDA